MHAASQQFDQAPVCQSGDNIIYAWAMDAPALTLPDGVAFKVGGDTDIQWLVLQVHYKDVSSFQPPSQSSVLTHTHTCLLYTSPSPRDRQKSRMPSSA